MRRACTSCAVRNVQRCRTQIALPVVEIRALAGGLLDRPASIEVARRNAPAEAVEQTVLLVNRDAKREVLAHLIRERAWFQVLVFTRTKHGANRLAEYLEKADISALAIHGNKSQNARTRALAGFKDGSLQVLVATDIAARGIDIDELPHVVNYELPNVAEDYVHRIGRTGRAGKSGTAIVAGQPREGTLVRRLAADEMPPFKQRYPFAVKGVTAAEFNQVKLLGTWSFPNAALHSSRPIANLADMKGKKFSVANPITGSIMVALGASPVTLRPDEAYQAISRGTIDGAVMPFTGMATFKLHEVAKAHLDAALGGDAAAMIMNKAKYDAMSPAQKKVVDDHCTTEWAVKISKPWTAFESAGRDKMKAVAGHETYKRPW